MGSFKARWRSRTPSRAFLKFSGVSDYIKGVKVDLSPELELVQPHVSGDVSACKGGCFRV